MPPSTIPLRLCIGLLVSAGFLAAGEEPSAHAPCYDRPELWHAEVGKTAYAKQAWPKAPLYVWSNIEEGTKSSGKGGKETDPSDPAFWTVDGKPATAPPSANDDVLFPKNAMVRVKEVARLNMRHLTVEQGARVPVLVKLRPVGNIWVKEGSYCTQLVVEINGDKDVFLRNDNLDWHQDRAQFANKIVFNKGLNSSIEVVGTVRTGDELVFMKGTTIVGPDSRLVPGNRSSQPIYPEARLVLMSGSHYHKRGNQPYNTDTVVSGVLQAGTPERPLTRDATIGLSFKAKGDTTLVPEAFKPGSPSDYGLVVNPKGSLLVHSADPQKARLVFTWNGLSSNLHKGPDKPDPVARHVDLVLQGKVDLAGVHFDRIRTGGILISDPAIRSKGAISFGEHNQGGPDTLFKILDAPIEGKLIMSVPAGELK